ncbi:MAG: PAS domain S-box protein, partial [Candidatus Electrothrix sp. ATG2]|nr:PAS domain S-box protein [Candidatus Electrothrix sp. ATG2]
VSGKMRNSAGQVIDFDHEDKEMIQQLEAGLSPFTAHMTSAAGHELGTVSLYTSSKKIEQELQKVIKESLINMFFLSITLSLLLFFSIQGFVLRPLALIVTALSQVDETGIPSGKISPHGALEIANLARSLSKMISLIKKSRQDLETQHARLQQSKKRLIRAEEKQREILWATNVGTWEWNVQSDETTLNERWADIIGYTLEEVRPCCRTTWRKFIHPEDLNHSELLLEKHLVGELDYYECEVRMRHKRGHWLWVLARGKIVEQDDDGTPLRMAGTHTDINDRKQDEEEKKKLEKELHQSQRLESIGLLAGGVAHDLNNILSGIIGYPELLLLDLPQESKLREPIEAIHESGQRAAAVVADLLTVARGAASTREVHSLNSLVLEYLRSPECEKLKSLYPNIIFRHQLEAAQPAVLCSPVHVKKCLMNLVTNAAEAFGVYAEGTVILTTLNHLVDGPTNTYHMEKGEYVVLNVQDNGPGIPQKDLEHIFEPFYTKKIMGRSGTGLGLTVVWNTMR